MGDVTRILADIEHGDPRAADQLLSLVYDELRKLAAQKMAHEAPDQTLQPTALVHEAWLRLVNGGVAEGWNGRSHFFGAAAEAMRRILVENARRKGRDKHGAGLKRVSLDQVDFAAWLRPARPTVGSRRGPRKTGNRRRIGRQTGEAEIFRRILDRTGCRCSRHLPRQRLSAVVVCAGFTALRAARDSDDLWQQTFATEPTTTSSRKVSGWFCGRNAVHTAVYGAVGN